MKQAFTYRGTPLSMEELDVQRSSGHQTNTMVPAPAGDGRFYDKEHS